MEVRTEKLGVRSSESSLMLAELANTYRKLAICLDYVQELFEHVTDSRMCVCLAVLEEDLVVLIEECEDYLIGAVQRNGRDMSAYHDRLESVLFEVRNLLYAVNKNTFLD